VASSGIFPRNSFLFCQTSTLEPLATPRISLALSREIHKIEPTKTQLPTTFFFFFFFANL